MKSIIISLLLYACKALSSDITLVGSTPGDEQIKSLLAIPADSKIDFIRWNLVLNTQHTFSLDIVFGESKPNTMGFKADNKLSIKGEYNINGAIYQLTSKQLPAGISIIKLNANVFHLLSPQKELLPGNGGWSYTLNRKPVLNEGSAGLPVLTQLATDTARQIIFEGRTPCREFADEYNLSVQPDCFKLKWKLVLNKDPKTLQPATYLLYRTNTRESIITGNWAIGKGVPSNPNAIIYQLDPDQPEKSISLLLGDENVLFFLHKDKQLYTGNEDFSFTLNRRK